MEAETDDIMIFDRRNSMHELAIARSIFEIVEKEALEKGLKSVSFIYLDIGALTAIVPDALKFGFEVTVRDTVLEGAEIVVNHVPLKVQCNICSKSFEPEEIYDLTCPDCRKIDIRVISGEELSITAIEGS